MAFKDTTALFNSLPERLVDVMRIYHIRLTETEG